MEQALFVSIYTLSIKHRLQTVDYRLGITQGLRYKTWTSHYGLGIKHGLRVKKWTVD